MKLSVMATVNCPECGSLRERNDEGKCPDCGTKAIIKVENETVGISENVEAYIKKHLNVEVLESMKKSQDSLQKFFESKQWTDNIRSIQALKKRTNSLVEKIAERKTKPFTLDVVITEKREIDETTNELVKKVLERQDEMLEGQAEMKEKFKKLPKAVPRWKSGLKIVGVIVVTVVITLVLSPYLEPYLQP